MSNDKNRKTSHEIVQYGSGPWNGKWVVRRTVTEDVAATLTRLDAETLMSILEKGASVFEYDVIGYQVRKVDEA